jgi:hypothetical protein
MSLEKRDARGLTHSIQSLIRIDEKVNPCVCPSQTAPNHAVEEGISKTRLCGVAITKGDHVFNVITTGTMEYW